MLTQRQHTQNLSDAVHPLLELIEDMVQDSPLEGQFRGIRGQIETALTRALEAPDPTELPAPNAVKPTRRSAAAGLC